MFSLERVVRPVFVHRNDDAVEADFYLHDVLHALGGAGVKFRLLHGPRGVGNVGEAVTGARTEQLDAAAGTETFDLWGLFPGFLGIVFRNPGGEREHGGGARSPDIVTGSEGRRAGG